MFIIWFCAIVGISLLILVLHQVSLGNIADGPQIGASISLLVFSLLAWSQTRDTNGSLTFQSAPQVPATQNPQPRASRSLCDAMTFQPITTFEPLAAERYESGMRIIGQNDPIPEEVSCAICDRNILQTRNEFGGVLVCPLPDCGRWYHKDHFYDTANGKCISPSCRRIS
jgi:hypothetical protein